MPQTARRGSADRRAAMGEGRGCLISISTDAGKEEMRCSRNRKAVLDNIIKLWCISCQRRLWSLLPWSSLRKERCSLGPQPEAESEEWDAERGAEHGAWPAAQASQQPKSLQGPLYSSVAREPHKVTTREPNATLPLNCTCCFLHETVAAPAPLLWRFETRIWFSLSL